MASRDNEDAYDYGEDFILTTSVENAMSLVKMKFLAKGFGIILLQLVALAGAASLAFFVHGTGQFSSKHVWLEWLGVVLAVCSFVIMVYVRTDSRFNFAALGALTVCLTLVTFILCGLLKRTTLGGMIELTLLQLSVTYAFLTVYCATNVGDFSFVGGFVLGLLVNFFCTIAVDATLVRLTLSSVFLSSLTSLLVLGYTLINLYLQCKELSPHDVDIAAVGLYTYFPVTADYVYTVLFRRESPLSSRKPAYGTM